MSVLNLCTARSSFLVRGKYFMSMWCLSGDIESFPNQECTLKTKRTIHFTHQRQLMRTFPLGFNVQSCTWMNMSLRKHLRGWSFSSELILVQPENNLQCGTIFKPACVAASRCQHVCIKSSTDKCVSSAPLQGSRPVCNCVQKLPHGGAIVFQRHASHVSSKASSFRKCLKWQEM